MRFSSWAVLGVAGGLAFGLVAVPASATAATDNGRILFQGLDRDLQSSQVFSITKTGKGVKGLTSGAQGIWNECPSWSSDAQHIFYDQYNRDTQSAPQVWRSTRKGADAHKVSVDPTTVQACPAPNPAGGKVAFVTADGADAQIAQMKTDGTGLKVVSSSATASLYNPRYSPDGNWLSYNKVSYNGDKISRSDIILYNRNTGASMNLTQNRSAQFASPAWDPNSKGIVAIRGDQQVVRLRINGKSPRTIYSIDGNAFVSSVSMAPKRNKLAYLVCANGDCGDPDLAGQGSLWTVMSDGTGAKELLDQSQGVQPNGIVEWGIAVS